MNYTRFSLYAPLLPGRRYSYELDQDLDSDLDGERRGQEEGREGLDGAADHYFGHDGYDRDEEDFVNLEQARDNAASTYNDSALTAELMQLLEDEEAEVAAPATSHVD